MNSLIATLSSLVTGLTLATSNFSPLSELQNLVHNRQRILRGFIIGAVGFVFVMASILIGLIESALQYEAQGYIFWSPLFTLSVGLFLVSVTCFAFAKLSVTTATQPVAPSPQIDFAQLAETFFKIKADIDSHRAQHQANSTSTPTMNHEMNHAPLYQSPIPPQPGGH